MAKLSQEETQEIQRLRSLFPHEIEARIRRSEDGGFVAETLTFPGVITEADTFSELIEMINDAVMSYFEVPREYAPFVANYIPPLEVAQAFGVFPIFEEEKRLKMQLATPA
ncbi:MAG: hypothetical protein A3B37_00845 [Candidatus Sungbacteria bacterium RIFCSPLOWO2_01_FULL_59_16]|uniref:DUF1902 domain-containing protein n=1 Tax=Candidatus Sungbacteria bacterium RIFCSPLOWO2_01_FULL_59_16 TaxID=1802280 RepID=A0A1G2LFD6_9BACT|nr:MAG: hypothetical protein A3B37_00845 [Candidatus Sungbacteria bacterium RIFCSPLOWO2_01_FULL_59_16]